MNDKKPDTVFQMSIELEFILPDIEDWAQDKIIDRITTDYAFEEIEKAINQVVNEMSGYDLNIMLFVKEC